MTINRNEFLQLILKNQRLKWILAILLILLLSIQWPAYYIQASNNESGEVLYRHSIHLSDEFEINYLHSVTKTPVTETYRIMPDKRLLLTEMVYQSYGAGLPTNIDSDYEMLEDAFRLYNINTVSASLIYRTDPKELGIEMKLVVDGDSIPFHRFSEERTPVKIEVKRDPVWLFRLKER